MDLFVESIQNRLRFRISNRNFIKKKGNYSLLSNIERLVDLQAALKDFDFKSAPLG